MANALFPDTTYHNGTLVPPRVLDLSDLTPIEMPVILAWEGKPTEFVLREPSHALVRHYRGQAMKGAELTFNDDGDRTLRHLDTSGALDTWLMSQCLQRLGKDEQGNDKRFPVKEEFLTALPDRAASQIMDLLQEMTPTLRVKEDLPALRKQAAKLQDKIKRLEEQEEQAAPKKLQNSGTENSALPTS